MKFSVKLVKISQRTKVVGLMVIASVLLLAGFLAWGIQNGNIKPKADTINYGNGEYQKIWDKVTGITRSVEWDGWNFFNATPEVTFNDPPTYTSHNIMLSENDLWLQQFPENIALRTDCISTDSGQTSDFALLDAINNHLTTFEKTKDGDIVTDGKTISNNLLSNCSPPNAFDTVAFNMNFKDSWSTDYAEANIDLVRLYAKGVTDPLAAVDFPNATPPKMRYLIKNPTLPNGNDIWYSEYFPTTALFNPQMDEGFINIKQNPFTGMPFKIDELRDYQFGFEIENPNPVVGKVYVDYFMVSTWVKRYHQEGAARMLYPNSWDNPDPNYTGKWQWTAGDAIWNAPKGSITFSYMTVDDPATTDCLMHTDGEFGFQDFSNKNLTSFALGQDIRNLPASKALCIEIRFRSDDPFYTPTVDLFSLNFRKADIQNWPIELIDDNFGNKTVNFTTNPSYTITPSPNHQGGTISVPEKTNVTVSFAPLAGYAISSVSIDGDIKGAINSFTFENIAAGHDVDVSTIKSTYKVISAAATGGTINPAGEKIYQWDAKPTYTITPDKNYTILKVTVNGQDKGAITNYTFENVAGADQNITATFQSTRGGGGGGGRPPRR